VLGRAADIIKKFIEEYHEKLEENYLFPRFVQANVLGNLTRLLKVQHEAGRKITAFILANANAQALENAARRREVADQLHAFWRMYRPHAAREDTVLFPALRRVVSPKEFQDLGEKFEDIEKEKFGQDGFDKMVDEVAELEQALGIEDLSRFTPPPPPARLQI
jgi:hemerythrin-like domain-containing protein